MTRALPVSTIDSALTALEAAAGRVGQLARAEQTAQPDALPGITAEKIAALERVNTADAQLRDALAGTAFAKAIRRLAESAPDAALRERARSALAAVAQARAENERSRRVLQNKLNFTRTMLGAIRSAQDESGLADMPNASLFRQSTASTTRRTFGAA